MPHAGNFNTEWGYLAPKPGFIRTLRMVLGAGAIGTVAGMAVAMALVARPAADLSVAARTMAQSTGSSALSKSTVSTSNTQSNAEVLASKAEHVAPPPSARSSEQPRESENPAAAESHLATTVQRPAGVAALAEAPAVRDNAAEVPSVTTPTPSAKRVTKKEQIARASTPRNEQGSFARSDQGSFAGTPSGPLDLIPFVGRTILGANPFWNDQVR